MSHGESFLDDPDDVINDPLIIAVGADAQRNEARENVWRLAMTSARAATTPAAAIIAFLRAVVENRNQLCTHRLARRFTALRSQSR